MEKIINEKTEENQSFLSFTKQKIKISGIILILAIVLFIIYYIPFGCLSILSSPPSICDSMTLPLSFIKILSVAFELPYFIISFFVNINDITNYQGIYMTMGIFLELIYVYLLASIYLNRKKIAEKVPKLFIILIILIFLYLSWIVLFNMPKILNGYNYYEKPLSSTEEYTKFKADLIEKGGYEELNKGIKKYYAEQEAQGYYSLIWPWAIYKGNRSDPWNRSSFESLINAILPLISLIMITLVIQYILFRKNSEENKNSNY